MTPALHAVPPAPPRFGVALSAGSAAAMAEIGALERLREAGLEFDCVAGTSAGAIVGAALAAERLSDLRERLESVTGRQVLRLFDPIWPREGLIEGRRGLELVRACLGETIEDLPRDFAAVATDLMRGEEVVLRSGPVIDAVRASIALPGIFTPWRVDGRLLVDGGLLNPLPVSTARGLGADFVVAIHVLPLRAHGIEGDPESRPLRLVPPPGSKPVGAQRGEEAPSLGLFEVLTRSSRIMAGELARHRLEQDPPEFLIPIEVPGVGLFDLHQTASLVEIGRAAAERALPALREALRARHPATPLRAEQDASASNRERLETEPLSAGSG